MQVVQTHLSQVTQHGINQLTAWLPVDNRVKVGSIIELDKNTKDFWKVEAQFETQNVENIQRGWGLDLPKSFRTER